MKNGDPVRISRYKIIFAKGYTQYWSYKNFVVGKVKNTVPWAYVINGLNDEQITGTFYKKEMLETNQNEITIENIAKRKGDKLCIKWKGYDNQL